MVISYRQFYFLLCRYYYSSPGMVVFVKYNTKRQEELDKFSTLLSNTRSKNKVQDRVKDNNVKFKG